MQRNLNSCTGGCGILKRGALSCDEKASGNEEGTSCVKKNTTKRGNLFSTESVSHAKLEYFAAFSYVPHV
jgi:hypothetical protein